MNPKLIDTFKQTADRIAFLDRGYGIGAPDVQSAIELMFKLSEINVRSMGIVPGPHDQTEKWNALVERVNNEGGGAIVVPPGIYRFESEPNPFLLGEDSIIIIIGLGPAIFKPQVKMNVFNFRSSDDSDDESNRKGYVFLRNFIIDGEDAGTDYDSPNGGVGIRASRISSIHIEGVTIKNLYGSGINVSRGRNVIIRGNSIENTWGFNPSTDETGAHDNYGDGVWVGRTDKAYIGHNYIYNDMDVTQMWGRAGIVAEYNANRYLIENNRIHGYNRGIHLESSVKEHIIRGNEISGTDLCIIVSGDSNGRQYIENNVLSNWKAPDEYPTVVNPRALIYFYRGGSPRSVIRNNELFVYKEFKHGDFIITQSSELLIEGNTFESNFDISSPNTFPAVHLYNTVGTKVIRNKFTRARFRYGAAKSLLIRENEMNECSFEDCSFVQGRFEKNILTDILSGYVFHVGCVIEFIDNTITNWYSDGLINNDGNATGQISGNTLRRTNENANGSLFRWSPVDRRPYGCEKPNTYTDENGTTSVIIPRGNIALGQGRRFIHGTNPPTSGNWLAGDVVINVTPSAGSFYGWICTESGEPGTWKGFGKIEE